MAATTPGFLLVYIVGKASTCVRVICECVRARRHPAVLGSHQVPSTSLTNNSLQIASLCTFAFPTVQTQLRRSDINVARPCSGASRYGSMSTHDLHPRRTAHCPRPTVDNFVRIYQCPPWDTCAGRYPAWPAADRIVTEHQIQHYLASAICAPWVFSEDGTWRCLLPTAADARPPFPRQPARARPQGGEPPAVLLSGAGADSTPISGGSGATRLPRLACREAQRRTGLCQLMNKAVA